MLPDKFTKRGTDVAIHLDADLMVRDFDLSVSAAGVILVNVTISPAYMTRVVMLAAPAYTLYIRPTQKMLRGVTQKDCVCGICTRRHRNGTQWRIGGCWMPLTWAAVRDRA
jgi:hypothetical protein